MVVRVGVIRIFCGEVLMFVFMLVGIVGSVKGFWLQDLVELGASICLGNIYYLMNRLGYECVCVFGGLYWMMGWFGNIFIDLGGF